MVLKIYNSLTNKKEKFEPLNSPNVGMYVCGVTVYDECHIGHARGAFVFDVIRKYLQYKGYKVKYVRNITDIDDKIINKARDLVNQYKMKNIDKSLKSATKEIAEKYIIKYYESMNDLGINKADIEPRATDHIDDMIKMIEELVKKGYAYQRGGDVYFEVKKFKNYGKLSNQTIKQLRVGVRKQINEKKKDPLDFALWKKSKEDEPSWISPFSYGRPGWHIECSVMSMKYLGENFDIHGGGRDLIFPHHENEIAQSESFSGKPFANYWIHNELLTIKGQKMAKSLGNFISVADILKKYHPEILKIFFLSSHYGSPIDFSFERMEVAKSSRERFYILFNKIEQIKKELEKKVSDQITAHTIGVADKLKVYLAEIEKERDAFKEAMDDNFNTPLALASLFELVNISNKLITDEAIPLVKKSVILNSIRFTLLELGDILGLFKEGKRQEKEEDMELLNKVMNVIIELREEARQKKDFRLADTIREKLKKIGVLIEDEKDKTIWRRK